LKAQKVIGRWATGQHSCEMALRRDGKFLFVANANDNTVTILDTSTGRAVETIWDTLFPQSPRGATPNSLALSPDEKMLFVANAKGRGAGPDNDFPPDNLGTPKTSTMGTVNAIPVPAPGELRRMSETVLRNNGFTLHPLPFDRRNPIPTQAGVESRQIKHVVFINKENSTHDQMLGVVRQYSGRPRIATLTRRPQTKRRRPASR